MIGSTVWTAYISESTYEQGARRARMVWRGLGGDRSRSSDHWERSRGLVSAHVIGGPCQRMASAKPYRNAQPGFASRPVPQANAQQDGQYAGVEIRVVHALFGQPQVMQHAEQTDKIDQPVQPPPVLAPQTLHHS